MSPEKVVDRLNFMNEQEINKIVDKMTKKFKNGGLIDCLRNGGSIKDCGCGAKMVKAQDGTGKNGLQVQIPKSRKDIKFENIRSSMGNGKAARYVTSNGRWEKTEFDYPESTIFGNGNDHTLWVRRNPQTGEVSTNPADSLVSTILGIRIPINMSADAPAIRSAEKRQNGGELKKNDSKAGDSKKLVNHEKEWSKTQKMEAPPKDKKKTFVMLEHLKNAQNTKPIKPLNYKK